VEIRGIDYHENCAGHKHPFQWPKKEGITDTIPIRLTHLFFIHILCPHESSNDAVVHNIIHQVKRIENG
jgi:hypothetical protein